MPQGSKEISIDKMNKFAEHCLENSPKFTGFLQFEFYGGQLKKTVKHQEYFERNDAGVESERRG